LDYRSVQADLKRSRMMESTDPVWNEGLENKGLVDTQELGMKKNGKTEDWKTKEER
jgi:hypothetical protein